jgi:hypothetical protein
MKYSIYTTYVNDVALQLLRNPAPVEDAVSLCDFMAREFDVELTIKQADALLKKAEIKVAKIERVAFKSIATIRFKLGHKLSNDADGVKEGDEIMERILFEIAESIYV